MRSLECRGSRILVWLPGIAPATFRSFTDEPGSLSRRARFAPSKSEAHHALDMRGWFDSLSSAEFTEPVSVALGANELRHLRMSVVPPGGTSVRGPTRPHYPFICDGFFLRSRRVLRLAGPARLSPWCSFVRGIVGLLFLWFFPACIQIPSSLTGREPPALQVTS